jgi:hypothetical protein
MLADWHHLGLLIRHLGHTLDWYLFIKVDLLAHWLAHCWLACILAGLYSTLDAGAYTYWLDCTVAEWWVDWLGYRLPGARWLAR